MFDKKMKISIITICFNNEKDIRATLESVVNQDYPNIEYIIKDGGSTDGTMLIVNEYRDKITKVITCPDKGIYDAINQGIQSATGDVVGLIHSGDRLHDSHVISRIAKEFVESNADIVYGSSKAVKEEKVVRVNIGKPFTKKIIRNGWVPPHMGIYVKNDCLKKYGLYRLDIGYAADYEWMIRYLYKHSDEMKIVGIKDFVVKFAMGGTSTNNMKVVVEKKQRDALRNSWAINGLTPPPFIVYRKWLVKIPMYIKAYFFNYERK